MTFLSSQNHHRQHEDELCLQTVGGGDSRGIRPRLLGKGVNVTIGSKIQHRLIGSSYVGVITGEGRDRLGDYWVIKVTSKTNPFYPFGTVDHVGKSSAWLKERV